MRKGEQVLVSSVSLMNCTSVGLEPTDSEQQSSNSFGFCVLFGSSIACWSLKHFLMFFAESFCQECFGFVCYSLQLSYSLVSFLALCHLPVSWFLLVLGWTTLSSMSAVENCQSSTLLSSVSGCFKVAACFHNEIVFHVIGSDVFATCRTSSLLCCFSPSLSLSYPVIALWYSYILALGFIVACVLCLSLLCCKLLPEISFYGSFPLKW